MRASLDLRVSTPQRVRVSVYNVLGQRVAEALDHVVAAGAVPVVIETADLAPGSYVVRVVGETFAETRRITVVR